MPTPEQKLEIRRLLQQAQAFVSSMEEAVEQDKYSQLPSLLVRLEGAMYDVRQTLDILDPVRAAIQDEFEGDA